MRTKRRGKRADREREGRVRVRWCTLPWVRNYVVLIKEDDRMLEFKFASLNEAAARLNELGYKSITRFNSMYCHKGKFSYPHMKVSKLTCSLRPDHIHRNLLKVYTVISILLKHGFAHKELHVRMQKNFMLGLIWK